jgi:hypothetical protein
MAPPGIEPGSAPRQRASLPLAYEADKNYNLIFLYKGFLQ